MAWVERVSRNSWRVRYWTDNGGTGAVYGFATKSAANQHAADMEAEQRAGTFIDPKHGKTTLDAWATDWLTALDVDIRTEENYRSILRRHIVPAWGHLGLSEISGIKVAGWAKDLRSQGLAATTVSGIIKLFTMILADAVTERLIAYNPIQPRRRGRARTTRPSERIWATPEQVLAVADRAATCYHPWGAMLIVTAAWTGARWGELTGLQRDNVHLDDGCLAVDPDIGCLHEASSGDRWLGPPKNGSSARTITLPEFLVPLLARHMDEVDSPFVFVTPERQWHRRSNFARRAMRPAADGIPPNASRPERSQPVPTEPIRSGLTFHGLRHSHKTWMIADGIPEVAQSRRLGHILPDKIQETYSHVAAEVEDRVLLSLQDRWAKATANSLDDMAWRTL